MDLTVVEVPRSGRNSLKVVPSPWQATVGYPEQCRLQVADGEGASLVQDGDVPQRNWPGSADSFATLSVRHWWLMRSVEHYRELGRALGDVGSAVGLMAEQASERILGNS